jgi:ribosome-binding protein aMBF1 (putative translation factor)
MEKEKAMKKRLFQDRLKEDRKNPIFAKAYEESDLPVRLAIMIAKIRERLGITQGELAKRMGTKQQVVSRLERGDDINPRLDTLEKAARAMGKHLELSFR